jgi:anti-anti-sigma regulatory factor
MKELAQAGVKCLILDFSNVAEIDSAGLGELIAGHVSMTQAGGSTILLNVSRLSKDLLRLTRLSALFPTYNGAASIVRGVIANRTADRRSRAERDAEPRMLSEVYLG